MNAPAPAKDSLSVLLLAGGLGLAAIAVVKLDSILQELGERVWNLENRRTFTFATERPAGTEYAEELVPEEQPAPRPAVKRTTRTTKAAG